MEALIKRLKIHEGLVLEPTQDTEGHWFIGHGHTCKPDDPPITIEEAESYLLRDVFRASDQYLKWKRTFGFRSTKVRDEVLVEFIYWFGYFGFLKFTRMIEALLMADWEKAAEEMMDSDAGRKYKVRMYELSELMRAG